MARQRDDEEERRKRNGRLIEGDDIARKVLGAGGGRGIAFYLRTRASLTCRRVARASAAPQFCARIIAQLPGQARRISLAPFHMEHDFVSRDRSGWALPACCRSGRKVAIFPAKPRDVSRVRKVGTYNQQCRVWTVRAGHKFLNTRKGKTLQTERAALARQTWLAGKGAAHSRQSAAGYQAYIERAALDDEARASEIEADEGVPISIGNMGGSLADRLRFWQRVEEFEGRHDSRLQSRIIFELPHWVTAGERRKIVERFGQLFADRGLGYWAVVHRPGPKGDKRNVHGHIAYHDRPFIGHAVDFVPGPDGQIQVVRGNPLFASKKDRSAQGGQWVEFLRREFANIVNDVLTDHAKQTGCMPTWFYFPGSYADLGIAIEPQQHLGARETALLRKDTATKGAIENLRKLEAGFTTRERSAIRSIQKTTAEQRTKLHGIADGDGNRSAIKHEFELVAAEATKIAQLLSDMRKLQAAPNMHQANKQLAELLEESAIAEFALPNAPGVTITDNATMSRTDPPRTPQRTTVQRVALVALACLCLLHRLEAKAAHLNALGSEGLTTSAIAINNRVTDPLSIKFDDRLFVAKSLERTALLLGAVRDSAGRWCVPSSVEIGSHRRLLEIFSGDDADIASRAEAAFEADQAYLQKQAELASEQARTNDLLHASDIGYLPFETVAGTTAPTDDQMPRGPQSIPPAPFIAPSEPADEPTSPVPKPAKPKKPNVRYVHEVSRKWVLDVLEAQFKDVVWIERLRGRPLVERIRNRLLLRISEIPTYSIHFHSPDGWRIEQVAETVRGTARDLKNRAGTFQSLPKFWIHVLNAALNQVALCLDPDDVRRQIFAAGLEVPEIKKGFFRIVDGDAELRVRKDAGQFQMLGQSARLEPLFQSLITARTELWKQHIDIGYRPVANLVHKSIHALELTDELQNLPTNWKTKRMLSDFTFCKTWALTCNPTLRPKQELTTAEKAARRKTSWVHVKLVAQVIKTPPLPSPPPVIVRPFFTPELVFEFKKVIERVSAVHNPLPHHTISRSGGDATPIDPVSPAPAPVGRIRQLWNWITGRAPNVDASPMAMPFTPATSGAGLATNMEAVRSAANVGAATSPETSDSAESERRRLQERLEYQTNGIVGRDPANPDLKRALEFVFMRLDPSNDDRLYSEIQSLPWQTLRRIRKQLDFLLDGHWDPKHGFDEFEKRCMRRCIFDVRYSVADELRYSYQLHIKAALQQTHVRQERRRSRDELSH